MRPICALVSFVMLIAPAAGQDAPAERYEIRQATIGGIADAAPLEVTVLLDRETGRTWMLAAIDGRPKWLPLPFNPQVPDNVLPPPLR